MSTSIRAYDGEPNATDKKLDRYCYKISVIETKFGNFTALVTI